MKYDQRHRVTQSVTLTGAGVNAALACLQIIFGLLGKSQALLADGIHTLSDLGTDFIVLFASNRAAKAADDDHPYGHARIETFASLLLGGILIPTNRFRLTAEMVPAFGRVARNAVPRGRARSQVRIRDSEVGRAFAGERQNRHGAFIPRLASGCPCA